MMRLAALFTLAYPIVLGALEHTAQRQPLAVFTRLGLTPQEVAAVDKGRPVAKVLSWGEPSEVYVFGAVHITGSPDTYLKSARDIKRLAAPKDTLGLASFPRLPSTQPISAGLCSTPTTSNPSRSVTRVTVTSSSPAPRSRHSAHP